MQLLPEWAPQSNLLMVWPHIYSPWKDNLETITATYMKLATTIAEQQLLTIICYDQALQQDLQSKLPAHNIHYAIIPTNDTWIRDFGPLSLSDGIHHHLLNCQFTAWGNKYPYHLDNAVNEHLYQAGCFTASFMNTVPFILEGGSIDYDGHHTLLTTVNCNCHFNRRAKRDRNEITQQLIDLLGVKRVCWLELPPLAGDDTDGHVDTVARFCNPHTIAYASCTNPEDEHYTGLTQLQTTLQALRDFEDNPYKLIDLPIPSPIYHPTSGHRLPATYANFQILNKSVLVPWFDDPMDEVALTHLAKGFPHHQLIPIDSRPLITQGGVIHCALMQINLPPKP